MNEIERAIAVTSNPSHWNDEAWNQGAIEAARNLALTALREKQERDRGCECCQQGEEMAYGQDSMKRTAYIYLDGSLLTADLYSESMAVAVCYCPMCGRELEVEHGE